MVQNNLGHSILGLYGVFCSIGNSNYQAYNASLIWSRKSNAKGLVTPSGEESPGIMIKIWNIFKYSFILIVPFYQFHTFIIVLSFIIKLLQGNDILLKLRQLYNGHFLWFLPNTEGLEYKDNNLRCVSSTLFLFSSKALTLYKSSFWTGYPETLENLKLLFLNLLA